MKQLYRFDKNDVLQFGRVFRKFPFEGLLVFPGLG